MIEIRGHAKDLGGGFMISRLLPSAATRSVGPFVFFDHFGPVTVAPDANYDVRPHPHIGLATVTYLFEGAIMHRDNLGCEQRITPGAINYMCAGRGIVHSERAPQDLRGQSYVNHGLQLWLALPADKEDQAPSFTHTPAADIPALRHQGSDVRVLIGSALGATSPVPAVSETLYLDLLVAPGATLSLPALAEQIALYPIDGDITIDGRPLAARTMGYLAGAAPIAVGAARATRLAIIGGAPLGPRKLWWNFVSSRAEPIAAAAAQWRERRFAPIPGDDAEFIPLPDTPLPQ